MNDDVWASQDFQLHFQYSRSVEFWAEKNPKSIVKVSMWLLKNAMGKQWLMTSMF